MFAKYFAKKVQILLWDHDIGLFLHKLRLIFKLPCFQNTVFVTSFTPWYTADIHTNVFSCTYLFFLVKFDVMIHKTFSFKPSFSSFESMEKNKSFLASCLNVAVGLLCAFYEILLFLWKMTQHFYVCTLKFKIFFNFEQSYFLPKHLIFHKIIKSPNFYITD
jgi:hypothetical protein